MNLLVYTFIALKKKIEQQPHILLRHKHISPYIVTLTQDPLKHKIHHLRPHKLLHWKHHLLSMTNIHSQILPFLTRKDLTSVFLLNLDK